MRSTKTFDFIETAYLKPTPLVVSSCIQRYPSQPAIHHRSTPTYLLVCWNLFFFLKKNYYHCCYFSPILPCLQQAKTLNTTQYGRSQPIRHHRHRPRRLRPGGDHPSCLLALPGQTGRGSRDSAAITRAGAVHAAGAAADARVRLCRVRERHITLGERHGARKQPEQCHRWRKGVTDIQQQQ